jgi:lysophospholipase L1-like esterase
MKRLLILFLVVGFQLTNAQDPKRFTEDIQKFEQLDQKSLSQGEILFVGSSSIRFWETLQQDFPNQKVLNRGFGGSHMSDLLFYLDELVLKYKPKQVFIYEGDNDINDKESPKSILRETKTLVEKIRQKLPETEIVLISAKPSISRWSLKKKYERLNKLFKKYAQKHSYLQFVDVWTPMLNDQGKPKEDIFIEDKLHMNAKGYEIWKEVIQPYLK